MEGKLPGRGGDRDVEAGDARDVGDVRTVRVAGEPEPGVGRHRTGHVERGPPECCGRVPAGGVVGRVARSVDARDGSDGSGAVDADVGQHDDGHVPDGLAGAVGGPHLDGVRAGSCRCLAVGRCPRHLEPHAADGVLGVGDPCHVLRDDVAVAQRCELAARAVDHGGVASELQTGDGAARADVLDEHLDAEVHRHVSPARVLAATEQRRMLPLARCDVVGTGGIDPVRHDAVAAERRHQRGGTSHLAGVPRCGVGLQRHRALAGDVLHDAVAHPAGVVGRRRHLPQGAVVGSDERERPTVGAGPGPRPGVHRRRRGDLATEPVATRTGSTMGGCPPLAAVRHRSTAPARSRRARATRRPPARSRS